MTFRSTALFFAAGAALGLALPSSALAQAGAPPAAPAANASSQQIVDALKPRSRSMRNLAVVESSAAAGAPELPIQQANSIDLALQFEFNSDQLTLEGLKSLNELASALATPDLARQRFLIQGHTDGKGKPAYNLKLSKARADEVRRLLVQKKVAPTRLEAEGKGATELLDAAHPHAAENRRVRIIGLSN